MLRQEWHTIYGSFFYTSFMYVNFSHFDNCLARYVRYTRRNTEHICVICPLLCPISIQIRVDVPILVEFCKIKLYENPSLLYLMSHRLIMQQLFIKFSSSVYSPTHTLPALDQLGAEHTHTHTHTNITHRCAKLESSWSRILWNFIEFYQILRILWTSRQFWYEWQSNLHVA
jgi:hypothetical protein